MAASYHQAYWGVKHRFLVNLLLLAFVVCPVQINAAEQDTPAAELLDLARRHFGEVSAAEVHLLREISVGNVADFSSSELPSRDHHDPRFFKEEARIRADCVLWLLTDPDARRFIGHEGVCMAGARIQGEIDLSFVDLPFPLAFICCYFDDPLVMCVASVRNMLFSCSSLHSLVANGLTVSGSLQILDNCDIRGDISLAFSNFGGEFSCRDTVVDGPNGVSLNGASAGRVALSDVNMTSSGIDIRNASITYGIEVWRANLYSESIPAFLGRGLSVGASILIAESALEGGIDLLGAELGNALVISETTLSKETEFALELSTSKIGRLQLGPSVTCTGGVRAVDLAITGSCAVLGSRLVAGEDFALDGRRMRVSGGMDLGEGTSLVGETLLAEAIIDGGLTCSGVLFEALSGVAVSMDQAEVGASAHFDEKCIFRGALSMMSAQVERNVVLRSEHLCEGRISIQADGLRVGGSLYLGTGERCEGLVSLNRAEIEESLFLYGWKDRSEFSLDLREARLGVLVDTQAGWPEPGSLLLEGLEYSAISSTYLSTAEARLEWIELQPEGRYTSQPYEHLARILESQGDEDGSQLVRIAKAKYEGRDKRGFARVFHSFIYGGLLGYGERPFRILWLGVALLILGTVFVRWQSRVGLLVENPQARPITPLNPLIYSLDLLIPVIRLYQVEHWKHKKVEDSESIIQLWQFMSSAGSRFRFLGRLASVKWSFALRVTRFWFWLMIVMGWGITTILLLAISGLLGG